MIQKEALKTFQKGCGKKAFYGSDFGKVSFHYKKVKRCSREDVDKKMYHCESPCVENEDPEYHNFKVSVLLQYK